MKTILLVALVVIVGMLSSGSDAQKHGYGKTGVAEKTTPYTIPFLVDPLVPSTTSVHALDRLVQQNSSLPFSHRFPKRERKSDKFHYPALPHVYWTLHKKPEVPLVEPENEIGFGYTDY